MIQANALLEKAKTSSFYLKMLNFSMSRIIPFNRPHTFRIIEVMENGIKVKLPYKNNNLNHLKGLHACALATLSEFTSGVSLISCLDISQYRIILKSLEMSYYYQGRMDAYASYSINPEWIDEFILNPLKSNDSVDISCQVETHDKDGNHLATGIIGWQIKPWNKVKSRQP